MSQSICAQKLDRDLSQYYKAEFIDKLPNIELPYTKSCGYIINKLDEITRKNLQPYTPAGYELLGKVNGLDSNYLVICLEKRDYLYPHLFTFSKSGSMIDHISLMDNNCSFSDSIEEISSFRINKDLEIRITDSSVYRSALSNMDSVLVINKYYIITENKVVSSNNGSSNSANSLSDSFSNLEIDMLNSGIVYFENSLMKQYGSKEMGLNYRLYLTDYKSHNLPKNVLYDLATTEYSVRLSNSQLFNKIWGKYKDDFVDDENIVIITTETNTKYKEDTSIPDFYVHDMEGVYMASLMNKMDVVAAKELLTELKAMSSISPQIIAGALSMVLKEEDYNSGLVRSLIANYFYYEMKINILNNQK
jgi:hypothetical protein